VRSPTTHPKSNLEGSIAGPRRLRWSQLGLRVNRPVNRLGSPGVINRPGRVEGGVAPPSAAIKPRSRVSKRRRGSPRRGSDLLIVPPPRSAGDIPGGGQEGLACSSRDCTDRGPPVRFGSEPVRRTSHGMVSPAPSAPGWPTPLGPGLSFSRRSCISRDVIGPPPSTLHWRSAASSRIVDHSPGRPANSPARNHRLRGSVCRSISTIRGRARHPWSWRNSLDARVGVRRRLPVAKP